MKTTKIGINGFGRIGRTLFRLLQKQPHLQVVAINDLADARTLAHLLKYDSIHGVFDGEIKHTGDTIEVDGKSVFLQNQPKIEEIDWSIHNVDIVVEATGKFKRREELAHHIRNGAKKVLLSVPPVDEDIKMIVIGINDDTLNSEDDIISNASCTTNNAAPMIKVIKDLCGIEQAYITTIHSYTSDQSLHDQPHKDRKSVV